MPGEAKLVVGMGGIAIAALSIGAAAIIAGLGLLSFVGLLLCIAAGAAANALLHYSWWRWPDQFPSSGIMWGQAGMIFLAALAATIIAFDKEYWGVQFFAAAGITGLAWFFTGVIWDKKRHDKAEAEKTARQE